MRAPIYSHTNLPKSPSVTLCTSAEDKARQEHKAECDITTLINRYKAAPFQTRPLTSGFQDFDADLTTAHQALSRAREMHAHVTANPELAKRYPDLRSILVAMANGSIDFQTPASAVPEAASAAEAATPAGPPKGDSSAVA